MNPHPVEFVLKFFRTSAIKPPPSFDLYHFDPMKLLPFFYGDAVQTTTVWNPKKIIISYCLIALT